jgi:hypothetical protein
MKNIEVDWTEAFNRLFDIINAEEDRQAPHYFSGTRFLKTLNKVDYSVPRNYMAFMESRREKGLSTTRETYYEELLNKLNPEKRKEAYLSFITELEPYNLPKLSELKALFGEEGDEVIKPVIVPEPKISDKFYLDVLNTINNALKGLEQKKGIYSGMGEEDIRDYLMMFLETRYQDTTATRESFNKSGKTDILLKHTDNTNLFVAECKVWSGQQALLAAINQLFDLYLTWRDSKAALLLFVRNSNFSGVLATIKAEVVAHPYFMRYVGDTDDSSFSYIFHLPGDKTREVKLEIMAFHLAP